MLRDTVVLSKDDFAELIDLRISVKQETEMFERERGHGWSKWEMKLGALLEKVGKTLKDVITPK